ncbi:hypothetical protein HYV85_00755 [Candidatus Woesearchaeota archaeon]|nr:hypothetical protein [Candidatus Woesearchaeota archaeon]
MKARKEAKTQKGEELLYVGIDEPITLRRALLESSKSLVHLLKQQQSLKQLRASKQRKVEELRGLVVEINELTAQAKHLMPQMEGLNLPAEEEERKPRTIRVIRAGAAAATQPRKTMPKISAPTIHMESHVDKLERELQEIEKKLRSL